MEQATAVSGIETDLEIVELRLTYMFNPETLKPPRNLPPEWAQDVESLRNDWHQAQADLREMNPEPRHVADALRTLELMCGLSWILRDWHEDKEQSLRAELVKFRNQPDLGVLEKSWTFQSSRSLDVVSLKKSSPLSVVVELPLFFATAAAAGALWSLFELIEKVWNLPLRISTSRAKLKAQRLQYRIELTSSERELIDQYASILKQASELDQNYAIYQPMQIELLSDGETVADGKHRRLDNWFEDLPVEDKSKIGDKRKRHESD